MRARAESLAFVAMYGRLRLAWTARFARPDYDVAPVDEFACCVKHPDEISSFVKIADEGGDIEITHAVATVPLLGLGDIEA